VLVFQQPAHQVRTRVVLVLFRTPGEEELRLDADQRRRHLQELPGPLQLQPVHLRDHRQELLGDARDRDVEDVDVLLANQVQQEVERPLEAIQAHLQRIDRALAHPVLRRGAAPATSPRP
jgi:hypothetical protein